MVFLSGIKSPTFSCKAVCFQVYRDRSAKPTVRLSILVGFMSKVSMKIDSESKFNGGFLGCTVVCATGSFTQVALTGFGNLF